LKELVMLCLSAPPCDLYKILIEGIYMELINYKENGQKSGCDLI